MITKRELLFWIREFAILVPTGVIGFVLLFCLPILLLSFLLGLLL